ncbi:unnamed protein product [Fusarium graminearum]|nr:unnamed protein product [Fusarium graminearum]
MPLLGPCLQAFTKKLSTSEDEHRFSFGIIHEATICPVPWQNHAFGERVEYKDLDSAQKQLSEILHTVKQDPTLKDISHLGSEGIYHCLITDRHVVNAIPLTSPLIKDLVGQLPYSEESENKFHGVNGTRSGSKKARSALCWVMV